MLPGYVFVETDDIELIYESLHKIDRFSKILGQEETIIPLADSEVMWLECLLKYCSSYNYEIPLSGITICGNAVAFILGLLANMRHLIKEINTHKRIAEVQIEVCGRTFALYMGIEIAV